MFILVGWVRFVFGWWLVCWVVALPFGFVLLLYLVDCWWDLVNVCCR